MRPWERWIQHISNLLVGGTGIVYAVMRYFMQPVDEFSVVNHPWQPHVQHLHVLFAPLLVFACGVIWQRHVMAKVRSNGRLGFSGPGLMLLFVPMVASGYLLQTTATAGWRTTWIVLHVTTSVLWIAATVIHLVRFRVREWAGGPANLTAGGSHEAIGYGTSRRVRAGMTRSRD